MKSIEAQCERVRVRIESLPQVARVTVAVGAAQRLMSQYLELPADRQLAFVVSWAEVIVMIWEVLSSPSDELNREIEGRLQNYYRGPNCHELGEDALPGADEDAASAAIYATEAYCTGSPKAAVYAVMRLLDDADVRADASSEMAGEDLMSENAKARRIQFQYVELDRLEEAISLVEQEGLTEQTLQLLKTRMALPKERHSI